MPTISAVIPTFNRLPYLRRALRSIFAQTVPVDEVVIVDDGSSDGTAEAIAPEYGDRVKLVVQANQGVSAARRAGVEAATSDWIAFLDSDDEWLPARTELFRSRLEGLPREVAWVFGNTEIATDSASRLLFEADAPRLQGPISIFQDPMPTQYPIQISLIQSSLIRRRVLLEVGAFTEGLRSSEDLLVGWQVAARYSMAAIPEVVTILHRESELASSSLDRVGKRSPDYHRARVIGYSILAKSGRAGAWGSLHSDECRRYCLRMAERQGNLRGLRKVAFQQFRHSISGRALLFAGLCLFGMPGIRVWLRRTAGRKVAPSHPNASLLSHEDSRLTPSSAVHD